MDLATLSRTLFSPVTLLTFTAAMGLYLYGAAFSRIDRDGEPAPAAARRTGRSYAAGTALTVLGLGTLLAHIVTRLAASGRTFPLGNMFEFTTAMVLVIVVGGLIFFQWRLRKPEVMGFVLLGALLTMGSALLLYNEPGPLMPILDSWWRVIHVSTIVTAAGIFTLGFVFTALYLLRDVAEERVARSHESRTTGSTVGAAHSGTFVEEAREPAAPGDEPGGVPDRADGDQLPDPGTAAYGAALRTAISPWRLALWTWLATGTLSWMFLDVTRFVAINTVMAGAAVLAWWFLPALPSAATLDSLAYRTIAFGFPIWTFGVLAGAIWAEQSWGRYWGWDPKETSAFLTWVAYAGYLHTRATRGWRGRKAAIVGVVAFGVLMFTYFAVNLLITGLHSYAGLQ